MGTLLMPGCGASHPARATLPPRAMRCEPALCGSMIASSPTNRCYHAMMIPTFGTVAVRMASSCHAGILGVTTVTATLRPPPPQAHEFPARPAVSAPQCFAHIHRDSASHCAAVQHRATVLLLCLLQVESVARRRRAPSCSAPILQSLIRRSSHADARPAAIHDAGRRAGSFNSGQAGCNSAGPLRRAEFFEVESTMDKLQTFLNKSICEILEHTGSAGETVPDTAAESALSLFKVI